MGIIQKQTLKGSVYSYIGLLIGFMNIGILSPRIFTSEQIGLTQVMLSVATILSQVGNLGFVDLSNRIFPWFRDKESANRGFLGLGLIVTLAGTLLVTGMLILNLDFVIHTRAEGQSLFNEYAGLLPLLLVLVIWFNFFDNYVKILYNAVIGTFLRDLLIRIINLGLIVLFYFSVIDFDAYIFLYVLNQGVPPLIVLVIYMTRNGEMRPGRFWEWIDKPMSRQLVSLGLNGLIVSFSWIAISNIDKYLINYYIGLDEAGIYSVSFYFATIIMIPGRSLGKIAVPLIADAWKNNDLKTISEIYRKSCTNQIAFGTLLVAGIVGNIDNIYRILPAEYDGGAWIIILISLSYWVNSATGASLFIIGSSHFYRYQTWLMLLMLMTVIVMNVILIPVMGIEGAALASLVAMTINSFLRVWVIYNRTRIMPFGIRDLLTVAVGIVAYLVSILIPSLPLLIDIAARSTTILVIFSLAIYKFNLSDELKMLMNSGLDLLKKII